MEEGDYAYITDKKQWYDQILAGTKKIEYREIKPYWTSRFLKGLGIERSSDEPESPFVKKIEGQKQHFDVKFRNGYESDSRLLLRNAGWTSDLVDRVITVIACILLRYNRIKPNLMQNEK